MIERPRFRLSLAAAIVATALPASDVLAQQSASCQRLLAMVDEVGNVVGEAFADARTVAESDDPTRCSAYVTRVESAGGLMAAPGDTSDVRNDARDSTESTATETIDVEQQATIEGEVQVTLPDPQVEVDQDPAQVSVRTTAPEVTVSQGEPTITVRQAQPIITVQMTQPTVIVEQPAPEIVITMPDPEVDIASTRPTVEVVIPEPRVTVTQGQPRLAVDLDTNVGDIADSGSMLEREDGPDGSMVVTANGLTGGATEPQIEYVDSEESATINYAGAEPRVEYIAAEADVRIESDGEPIVEMIDGGEPKIMIRQEGDDEVGADPTGEQPEAVAALAPTDTAADGMGEQRDPREVFAGGGDAVLAEAENGTMRVGDLEGMEVVNARGEELGEVGRIVRNGNDTYVIVEHGGWFFGLNDKEIALPADDITMRDEAIVLRGLTEAQIESMPDYDYENEVALEADDEVMLRRLD